MDTDLFPIRISRVPSSLPQYGHELRGAASPRAGVWESAIATAFPLLGSPMVSYRVTSRQAGPDPVSAPGGPRG